MTIVAIISPKGGVGKTTVAANLGVALAGSGNSICMIDFDPQNALGLHFGMKPAYTGGIMPQTLSGLRWHDVRSNSVSGVQFFPYGVIAEENRVHIEQMLLSQPDWLRKRLADLGGDNDGLIIIDTPPGPSVYMQQVLTSADVLLVVVQPNAASYAAIPQMELLLKHYCAGREYPPAVFYLVNQMDASKALNRDTLDVLRARLGSRLIPVIIHRDEAVSESLAFQQSVLQYARYAQATEDFQQVAKWLEQHLQLTFEPT